MFKRFEWFLCLSVYVATLFSHIDHAYCLFGHTSYLFGHATYLINHALSYFPTHLSYFTMAPSHFTTLPSYFSTPSFYFTTPSLYFNTPSSYFTTPLSYFTTPLSILSRHWLFQTWSFPIHQRPWSTKQRPFLTLPPLLPIWNLIPFPFGNAHSLLSHIFFLLYHAHCLAETWSLFHLAKPMIYWATPLFLFGHAYD